jgi:hypothetical protein
MYVADESRRIKNPTADRTKVVVKSCDVRPVPPPPERHARPQRPVRPVLPAEVPGRKLLGPHGIQTFSAFKAMFGIFQKSAVRGPGGVLREFNQLLGYKNLDLLQRIVGTICSRITKEDGAEPAAQAVQPVHRSR